ncbi:unnamed protein product [Knipowitschia caucasica]
MWTSLFLQLVFHTAVLSSTPKPNNVTFTSKNFRNILNWFPGYGAPADTKYSVRYAIYGDSVNNRVHWRPVPLCSKIFRTWCDLSVETSDPEHGYFARVRAVAGKGTSKWVETPRRFDPMIDTEFGPPHISLELDEKYVHIKIEGPMKYRSLNQTPQVSMATLFPHMVYTLTILNTRRGITHHLILTEEKYKYRFVDYGTKYCFSAKTKLEDRYMSDKHQSSAQHCILTPEVELLDRLERIVIICTTVPVLLLCLLVAGGYILHRYLSGKDQKTPYILNSPIFLPAPLPTISEDVISIAFVGVEVSEKLYPKYLSNSLSANASPVPPPLVDVSDKESVDYGFVSRCDERADGSDAAKCQEEMYKKKEWLIAAGTSSNSLSQNSFLQTLSSSSMTLHRLGENLPDLSQQDSEALQNSQNEISNIIDDASMISSAGYASQSVCATLPNNPLEDTSDDYGLVGMTDMENTEELHSLHLNWSPSTRRLTIPGLDLGTALRERGGPPTLETVFVRQPSEEESPLGAERSSDPWDTEEFKEKWNLIVSND